MPADNKTHDALVATWQQNAKTRDNDNYEFLRSLKHRSPKKVDRTSARPFSILSKK